MASRIGRVREGARNALELLRRGRLGAPYHAPYEVVASGPHHRLRRYEADPGGPHAAVREPLLLVPPLMVAAEVYDISPELSPVAWLTALGLDVWVVDFGAPEREDGGLQRTLDDHVLAVDAAIETVRETCGADPHLAGYSQGGMFCYQVAAYRRSQGLASVITFGSPVDLRRSLPVPVRDPLVERLVRALRGTLASRLEELDGLPGAVTSTGFKVFSARKEVQQMGQLLRLLPDRDALARREPTRRFLGGEGFVAWPGPAFRDFVDRVVVENRMTAGGLVIDGRAVALSDLTCPILYFVGTGDEMARPSAVRGIRKAAPGAELHEVRVDAGHFGLVVGSRALGRTWPTVAEWMVWRAGLGGRPAAIGGAEEPPARRRKARGSDRMYQLSVEVVDRLWTRMGEVSEEVADVVHAMRWQLPRLARLESLHDDSRVNLGRAVQEQARALPHEPFFFWADRAFTWSQADARVDGLLGALVSAGLRPRQRVGIWMEARPDFLTVLTALSRLGAVAVPLDAAADGAAAARLLERAEVEVIVVDGAHADRTAPLSVRALRLHSRDPEPRLTELSAGTVHEPVPPPADTARNAGRGADVAMLLQTDDDKLALVTNRRIAMAALATAAASQLTPADTVWSCLPLHTAAALLVAVGGAVAGGCRIAVSPAFRPETFWDEVRRAGATVIVHDGQLPASLVAAPPRAGEERHPVRMWVGPPMAPSVQTRLLERFGQASVLSFYASTEGNVVLADLDAEKPGSVGRPFVDGLKLALVRFDRDTGAPRRDRDGRLIRCRTDEPGLLLARIDHAHPVARFDGYLDAEATEARILRDAFAPGDAWYQSGDVLRRDRQGVYWVVRRRARPAT